MRNLPRKAMLAVATALLLVLCAPAARAGDVSDQMQRGMNEIQRHTQRPAEEDLDLNYASQSQLETLPNVDRETARSIMDNRPYRSMQDLSRAGLSQRTIDGLYHVAHVSNRDYATSGSDRRELDLNYASQSQLETLPNVDRETARRIMDNRPYRSMQDLSRAGLSQRMIDRLDNVAHVSSRNYATSSSDRRYAGYQGRGRWSARVWVDPHRKLYYREGSPRFGHTRGGSYMSEGQALKHDFHLATDTGYRGRHEDGMHGGGYDTQERR